MILRKLAALLSPHHHTDSIGYTGSPHLPLLVAPARLDCTSAVAASGVVDCG